MDHLGIAIARPADFPKTAMDPELLVQMPDLPKFLLVAAICTISNLVTLLLLLVRPLDSLNGNPEISFAMNNYLEYDVAGGLWV